MQRVTTITSPSLTRRTIPAPPVTTKTTEIRVAKIVIKDGEGNQFTAAISYGNAFLLKDELQPLGCVYWSHRGRSEAFNAARLNRDQQPDYFLQPYPYYINNGIADDWG